MYPSSRRFALASRCMDGPSSRASSCALQRSGADDDVQEQGQLFLHGGGDEEWSEAAIASVEARQDTISGAALRRRRAAAACAY